SSRLSLGPASDLRRARASEAVLGAGATGPFLVPRLVVASSRLGVGRPLGSVLRDPRGGPVREPAPESARKPAESSGVAGAPAPSSWSFLRPGSFTLARLLCG